MKSISLLWFSYPMGNVRNFSLTADVLLRRLMLVVLLVLTGITVWLYQVNQNQAIQLARQNLLLEMQGAELAQFAENNDYLTVMSNKWKVIAETNQCTRNTDGFVARQ
ncbi:MAG: hypothetical protein HQM11_18945 [SAR324 cluster bacterium]|nr:hypothetical protein [SAR324 cluster bacterium]